MYLAIFNGFHETRPDYSPEVTTSLDEFARENEASPEETESMRRDLATKGYAWLGGGAGVEVTIFPDPDYDPNHEGVGAQP